MLINLDCCNADNTIKDRIWRLLLRTMVPCGAGKCGMQGGQPAPQGERCLFKRTLILHCTKMVSGGARGMAHEYREANGLAAHKRHMMSEGAAAAEAPTSLWNALNLSRLIIHSTPTRSKEII